jgi:hypothetical protein
MMMDVRRMMVKAEHSSHGNAGRFSLSNHGRSTRRAPAASSVSETGMKKSPEEDVFLSCDVY